VYYLKGIVSVCFRCPARTVGFSGTRLYLCILQPTKLSDAQVLPTSWLGGSTRGLQPGHTGIEDKYIVCRLSDNVRVRAREQKCLKALSEDGEFAMFATRCNHRRNHRRDRCSDSCAD